MSKEKKIEKVKTACEKHWEEHKKNCSGFVKAVANDLGITITGQANDIVDNFKTAVWKACTDGVDARQKATEGHLVIGGLKKPPKEHFVVVVPGLLAHGKYPTAYWGSMGSFAKKIQP